MEVLEELLYTKEHEWVRKESDGSVVIGVSDYAQEQLGDIVYVELPEMAEGEDVKIDRDEPFAVIESVKAASDVYSPLSGKLAEINDELPNTPAVINEDCYGDGWLVRLEPSNPDELDELMSADDYYEFVESLSV